MERKFLALIYLLNCLMRGESQDIFDLFFLIFLLTVMYVFCLSILPFSTQILLEMRYSE